jgi:membrane protein YdbS with pleckstrin-like domain
MSKWFVSKGGKTHGPFSSSQLKQLAVTAKINRETEVRLGTNGKWTAAKHVKGLFPFQATENIATATATSTFPSVAPSLLVAARDSRVGERELFKIHPSFFRNDPIEFSSLLFFGVVGWIVVLVGLFVSRNFDPYYIVSLIGLILALICGLRFLLVWLRYRRVALIVTDKRTILRFGLLSRYLKEIRHSDVRMLVVKQGFLQRLLGVGQLDVASAASDETDIRIAAIPNPDRIKQTIDSLRT